MPENTDSVELTAEDLMTTFGTTGLRTVGGFVREEWHRRLVGRRGMQTYREMIDNDDVIGAALFAIDMSMRSVEFRSEPADESEKSKEAAEFLDSNIQDMSQTWEALLSEILSFNGFGWSYFETIYKQRLGPDQEDPAKRSDFDDGRIGWRKHSIRAQDTLWKWEFDDDGGIRGMWQVDNHANRGKVFLPIEKCLLFRTKEHKGNPEGRSLLRNAYRAWYFKKRLQENEAIGAERDLAGYPIIRVPQQIMMQSATAEEQAIRTLMEELVVQVRRDEREGMVFPARVDVNGNPTGYDFELLTSGGRRQMDVGKMIERYDKRIAATLLHDWILMGQDSVGSFALASEKTQMSSLALQAMLGAITSVFNRIAIPRLFELNPEFPRENWPTLVHGDIESPPLKELAEYINSLVGASVITPDAPLERKMRDLANLPELDEESALEQQDLNPEAEDVEAPEAPEADESEAPDPEQPEAPEAPEATSDIASESLNGAQVKSMVEVIQAVAQGLLPRESGVNILVAAFALTPEDANQIMGEVGRSFILTPSEVARTPDAEPAETGELPGGDDDE